MQRTALVLVLATAGLTGCGQRDSADASLDPPPNAEYLGVDTLLLDDNTVNFLVQMRGARGREDVVRYARCVAAQYALTRGHSFAQHVRTNVERQGSLWLGDGGFVISPDLPRGVRNMDAEVIVDDCLEQGIPTG